MQTLMNETHLLDYLNYTSTDCVEAILRHYYDIEYLACEKGYPSVLDLYIELKTALSKLDKSESQIILKAVGSQDEKGIKDGARTLQRLLLGMS